MQAELLGQGVVGNVSEPWTLLLQSGKSAIVDASRAPEPQTSAPPRYCAKDERAYMTVDEFWTMHNAHAYNAAARAGKRVKPADVPGFAELLKDRAYHKWYFSSWPESLKISPDALHELYGEFGEQILEHKLTPKKPYVYTPLFLTERRPAEVASQMERDYFENSEQYYMRMSGLKGMRKRDAAGARDALAERWEEEDAKVRPKLLQALWFGLSADDAPFLEQIAQGKDKKSAELARVMLASLPETTYAKQVRELALRVLKDGKLELPEYGPEYKRAGFPKSDPETLAIRVLSQVPLAFWEETFHASPEELARIFPYTTEDPNATQCVYAGWTSSFFNYGGDFHWVDALTPFLIDARIVDSTLLTRRYCLGSYRQAAQDYFDKRQDFFGKEIVLSLAYILLVRAEDLLRAIDKEERRLGCDAPLLKPRTRMQLRVTVEPRPWSKSFQEEFFHELVETANVEEYGILDVARQAVSYPPELRERLVQYGLTTKIAYVRLVEFSDLIRRADLFAEQFGEPSDVPYFRTFGKFVDACPWLEPYEEEMRTTWRKITRPKS